jgi:TatD DNase family protein
MIIDTHAHIYLDDFQSDVNDWLYRASEAGVSRIYMPNIDLQTIPLMKKMEAISTMVYPMIGLHPCSVSNDFEQQLTWMYQELQGYTYHGIGETGIDLYWDPSTLDRQLEAFTIQATWAAEFDLPLIIHSRQATTVVLDCLEKLAISPLRGVFHCFSGNQEEIERIARLGNFYFGIGGVITYKKAGLFEAASLIPIEKLVVETDSPYLPPVPFRGKRNEPSYTRVIVDTLANALGLTIGECETIVYSNSERLFKKNR